MLKGDIEPWKGMTTAILPDDLVVDILSRLPLKSFHRFKCVCKSWLAFSYDPHYRQKLPRTPSGFLYQKRECAIAIHFARLLSSDRDIDTTLSFLPYYEYALELTDCSSGLVLCYLRGHKHAKIPNAIVCNPATEEWMSLPDTQPGPYDANNYLRLGFDPLWSQHFYVFNFQWSDIPDGGCNLKVKVFFSEDSTWSTCLWETDDPFWCDSLFVNGVLYVRHLWGHCLLALDAPNICSELLSDRSIELPGFPYGSDQEFYCCDGCLSQSAGVLCYAQQELDGCVMRIWSLEGSDRWVVKHHVSMADIFGSDILFHTNSGGLWNFDYKILAFDLEREVVILDEKTADKVLSVSISTGEGSEILNIPNFFDLCRSLLYVPYYLKFPGSVLQVAQDGC